ncbi:hypothetical protein PVAND_006843 [Polypedilum vanderplanki]|uniref:Sodium/potassium-transporting ATPase subunit beta-2 n=1 Tax=Polypedilum vanderplanki TaxID=319348 RepID=A0A9J6C5F5_POLVA|nr:hypothetical protein PVAND_006843 [Polypedilum vanderplanki]
MADKNKSDGDAYLNRPEKLGAWDGFKQFLWNSDTKQFMGRTSGSWLRILIFYIIFYIVLAIFFVTMFFIFGSTLTKERPKYELKESLIGTNPGLGFRPMPPESNVESTLIWYQKDNPDNSKYWVEEIDRFLEGFKGNSTDRVDCRNSPPEVGKICNVNLDAFKPCISKENYGYEQGRPCIFLKLNKIYNWEPEYYNNSKQLAENMPKTLVKHIEDRQNKKKNTEVVWVSCEGENPADIENLGNSIDYYSLSGEQGFLGNYFPFLSTKGYLQPLVAVQFKSVKPGVLINIECKAWAKNIKHDRTDRRGSVHFELMIDEVPKKKGEN